MLYHGGKWSILVDEVIRQDYNSPWVLKKPLK